FEQQFPTARGVVRRERAHPWQHRCPHRAREGTRPFRRLARTGIHERVSDALGRNERPRHHAAEQIGFARDAEGRGDIDADYGLTRNEIDYAAIARLWIVIAGVLTPFETRELLRDELTRRAL